jgi:hypothetical protein
MHEQLESTLPRHSGTTDRPRLRERILPSFWHIQLVGWVSFFLLVLLATFPELKAPGTVREDILTVVFMFFGSCVLRPVCRSLQRSSLPWMRMEARSLEWCLFVGPIASGAAVLVMAIFRAMSWGEWLVVSVQFIVVLFLWCSLYFNAKYWQQAASVVERASPRL